MEAAQKVFLGSAIKEGGGVKTVPLREKKPFFEMLGGGGW